MSGIGTGYDGDEDRFLSDMADGLAELAYQHKELGPLVFALHHHVCVLLDEKPLEVGKGPAADAAAVELIAEILRDPDWNAAMLEDIAQHVRETGRTVRNYPDRRSTWARH